jgi:hypothetical protein
VLREEAADDWRYDVGERLPILVNVAERRVDDPRVAAERRDRGVGRWIADAPSRVELSVGRKPHSGTPALERPSSFERWRPSASSGMYRAAPPYS